ncbi:hypothetical protein B0T16DRAFT_390230 [Cercophora newfieldiana]|uniref:Uncharacterized protein n=1 Tax=Cercophora newfieldiana TaxID=92897 RepID=A0AA39Y420_9PEZI|nr:hypothetical protein B0T16DRAFT_390230 [Cercophora newfieldiana]
MMLAAESRSWLSGPPAATPAPPTSDATLSPHRRSRSRPQSEASAEPPEDPPPKRRRRRLCGFGSDGNSIPNSESSESSSNNPAGSRPHTGEAGCQACVDQVPVRPDPEQLAAPVEHPPDHSESCTVSSIDNCRIPNAEALLGSSSIDKLRLSVDELSKPLLVDSGPGGLQSTKNGTPATASGWWFYNFPPEIRNMIYEYSLDWPTSHELYAPYNSRIDDYYANKDIDEREFPVYSGALKTPTILLLCRGITAECLPILQSRHFVVDRLPPWLPGASRPMRIPQFVGRRTIQSLRHIELRLPVGQGRFGSGWVWADIVTDIFDILRERNSFDTLKIVISIFNDRSRSVWELESENLNRITDNVRGGHSRALRGASLTRITHQITTLSTKNPRFWAPGQIEDQYWTRLNRQYE